MRPRSPSRSPRKSTGTPIDSTSPESLAELRDDLSSAVNGLKSTIQLTGSLLRSFAESVRASNAFEVAGTVAQPQSRRPRLR